MMLKALIDYLRGLHDAIRNTDRIGGDDDDESGDDDDCKVLAKHCHYLLNTEAAAWIPTGKRREILADLHRVEVRDSWEQVDAGSYLEFVGGKKP